MVQINIVNELHENIVFSEKSEKESHLLSGEECKYALRPKDDDIKIKFEILENDTIVSQGIIMNDNMLIMFTTGEHHSISYMKILKKELQKYILKDIYVYTYTMRWYKESIKFLEFLGFYMSSRNGEFEKWVLEKRQ